jgi:hypothetical protein
MNQDAKSTTPDPQDRKAARQKLVGRAMVVLLLALAALYAYVTFR